MESSKSEGSRHAHFRFQASIMDAVGKFISSEADSFLIQSSRSLETKIS